MSDPSRPVSRKRLISENPLFSARWLPPAILYLVIFWFSSRTQSQLPRGIPDVIPHFLEFALLAFLVSRVPDPYPGFKKLTAAWVLVIFLAFADELHQLFVPTRFFSLKDILVDAVGAGAGILFYRLLRRLYRKEKPRTGSEPDAQSR